MTSKKILKKRIQIFSWIPISFPFFHRSLLTMVSKHLQQPSRASSKSWIYHFLRICRPRSGILLHFLLWQWSRQSGSCVLLRGLYPLAAFALELSQASSTRQAVQSRKFTRPVIPRVTAGSTSGITISQLGCGTWSWGNRLLWDYDPSQDEEIYQSYALIRDAGVTIFDTADSYGTFDLNGRAEILLGQFERRYQAARANETTLAQPWWQRQWPIKQKSLNSNNLQQVATKFAPYPWRITRGSIVQAAKESLARLEQPQLEIAQLHWSTANYQPLQEGALWEGIADVYDAGLCRAVGVSNYGPQQLIKVANRFKARKVPLAIAQVQYSLMTYGVGQYMNEACDEVDCRLVSYSPLCLGLLTGKYNLDNLPRPGNPRRQLFRELLPGAQGLLRTLDAMGKEFNKTPSQIAINWAVSKNTVPIPGCRTISQAESNIQAVQWRLSPDAIEELDRLALAVKKPMIQNIFQTK
jgi:pyridoxine 4-dehydrogenase